MTKVLSQTGLTELIQLSKNEFLPKSGAVEATTVSLATVATSGSYNDLSNKPTIPTVDQTYDGTSTNAQSGVAIAGALNSYVPTSRTVNGKALSSNISLSASDVGALPSSTVIPTVNNAALTITQGGTTKGTFTANASSNVTIDLDAGSSVDNSTISLNSSDELQTIAVKNRRDNSTLPIWQGTEAQWTNGEQLIWYNWKTPDTSQWSEIGSFQGNGASYIAYGNGLFLLKTPGNGGYYYSTDGSSWTKTNDDMNSGQYTTFGGGNFVSIYNGSSYRLIDDNGLKIVNGGTLYYRTWVGMAYGNGKFLAISNQYTTQYSTDGGVTWSLGANLPETGFTKIIFGNDKFIVIKNEKVYYSADGTSWTRGTDLPSSFINDVAFGDGKFIAIYSTKSYYSLDITSSWTQSGALPSTNWEKLIYGDGIFYAIKYRNTYSTAYSKDGGLTWVQGGNFPDNYQRTTVYANGNLISICTVTSYSDKILSFAISSDSCYTDTANPTTSSTVYSAPAVTSSYTISSVTSGAITLSDNNTYYYNQSGNQYTYQTIGVAHPDWLCFINGVGVKIGNTTIATNNSNS